jgi:Flp pilus assembly pilin Flp
MLSLIKGLCRRDDGATAIEYAMLVVFIALAIAVGAQTLGKGLTGLFSDIGGTLSGVTIPSP